MTHDVRFPKWTSKNTFISTFKFILKSIMNMIINRTSKFSITCTIKPCIARIHSKYIYPLQFWLHNSQCTIKACSSCAARCSSKYVVSAMILFEQKSMAVSCIFTFTDTQILHVIYKFISAFYPLNIFSKMCDCRSLTWTHFSPRYTSVYHKIQRKHLCQSLFLFHYKRDFDKSAFMRNLLNFRKHLSSGTSSNGFLCVD